MEEAPPTTTVPCPVFPSVPSPRLQIPTSSGHGIHSARKVKAVGCGVTAVCMRAPVSVAADLQAGSRGAAVAQLDRFFLFARLMCNNASSGEIHRNVRDLRGFLLFGIQ